MNSARVVRTVLTETGAVLLNTDNGATFRTNLVGAQIWKYLSKGATKDELANRLSREYGVPTERISTDVEDFLKLLEKNGLLQKEVDAAR